MIASARQSFGGDAGRSVKHSSDGQSEKACVAHSFSRPFDSCPAAPARRPDVGRSGGLWLRVVGALAVCGLFVGCAAQQAPVVSRTPQTPPAVQAAPEDRVHVVVKGDTLYGIAWRYETTVADLARINGLGPPYLIRVGQRLRVDAPRTQPQAAGSAAVTAVSVPEPRLSTAPAPQVQSGAASAGGTGVSAAPSLDRTAPETTTAAAPRLPPSSPPQAHAAPAPAASDQAWRWPVEGKFTRQYDSNRQFKGINIQSKAGTRVRAAAPGEVVYAGDGLRGYGKLIIVKHDDVYLSAYAHNRSMKVREGERVSSGQDIGEVGGDAANPGRLYFEIRKEGKPIDPTRLLPTQ